MISFGEKSVKHGEFSSGAIDKVSVVQIIQNISFNYGHLFLSELQQQNNDNVYK